MTSPSQSSSDQGNRWPYPFAGGGYFLNNFSMALLIFFWTFSGFLPDPRVLEAAPRQICCLAAASYISTFKVPTVMVELVVVVVFIPPPQPAQPPQPHPPPPVL